MTKKKKKNASKKKGEYMEIKVSRIKEELSELNTLIEDYELSYLNLYNIVNDMTNYWQDGYSERFFKDVEIKKINVSNTIEEIKNIKDVYKYLVSKYESIGNTIKFDLNYKNSVITYLDTCIEQCKNIISSYGSLDISFCGEAGSIRNEISLVKVNKERLENYKEKLKKIINYIEESEKEIASKISSISIEIIEVQDIENFV